jgi:hypothetical protein
MDNEMVLLTSIVVTLFVVFGITVYREFSAISKGKQVSSKESGPRAQLVSFMGRLFDEESNKKLTIQQKDLISKAVHRTIADMESDGIYFTDEVKMQLKKQRDELNCEYSGLPSVKFYEKSN